MREGRMEKGQNSRGTVICVSLEGWLRTASSNCGEEAEDGLFFFSFSFSFPFTFSYLSFPSPASFFFN